VRTIQLFLHAVPIALAMACAPAQAQLFRAYVASNGLDTNPCTLPQPCRLLPAALAAVASGGEIWMLDSANYNTAQVDVTKSVTILAVPGALGSLVSTGGGQALNISAVGAKVALRNLVIVHLTSSSFGVTFVLGDSLHIDDCEISGLQGGGVLATASNATVTVRNTVVRDTGTAFQFAGHVVATLDRVQAAASTTGVYLTDGTRVKVSDSVLADNGTNILVTSVNLPVRLAVNHSILTGGTFGLQANAVVSGASIEAILSDSNLSAHSTAAISATRSAGSTLSITADTNWITQSGTAFEFASGSPTIYSRGNNTLRFNTADVTGGSLTPLATQ
jgi:hypothetical protein